MKITFFFMSTKVGFHLPNIGYVTCMTKSRLEFHLGARTASMRAKELIFVLLDIWYGDYPLWYRQKKGFIGWNRLKSFRDISPLWLFQSLKELAYLHTVLYVPYPNYPTNTWRKCKVINCRLLHLRTISSSMESLLKFYSSSMR